MKKGCPAIFFAVLVLFSMPIFGQAKTWGDLIAEMETILEESYTAYNAGDIKKAKDLVNKAYFGYYEKFGIEKTVQAYISGRRAAEVEYEFSTVKKNMTAKKDAEVRASLDLLIKMLWEDANQLDGKKESPWSVFFSSFFIIVREGVEAILVIAAIIAYLLKSGNKDKLIWVYWGIITALIASILLVFLLKAVTALSGANQEIIEGVTMLVAVVVLFYVSNWMVGKAHGTEWARYVQGKVQASISSGGLFSLAFGAFLAVFREGAETILFYQALFIGTGSYTSMIWAGLGGGFLVLIVVYYVFVVLSRKIPLKPFFIATSVLLYILAISFAGTAVKEFQEAGAISVTAVSGFRSVSLLGIYPTIETLLPQIVLLLLAVFATWRQVVKHRTAPRAE